MVLASRRIRNFFTQVYLLRRRLPPAARKNLSALEGLWGGLDVRRLNFVVFDLETSGLSPKDDRVLSVGAIRLSQGLIDLGSCFHKYVHPGRAVSHEAVTLHGIKPDQVASAPSMDTVFEEFVGYAGSAILVAHQAAFDTHFLNAFMKRRYGFGPQNLVIDTLSLCRALYPPRPFGEGDNQNEQPFGLDSLVRHFDLKLGIRHTALGDALITAMVLQRLLARLIKVGKGELRHLVSLAGHRP